MPAAGGHSIPPNLMPGNGGRNGGLQVTSTGLYGDGHQSQSPTDISSPTTGASWGGIPPSAPNDSFSQPDHNNRSRSPRPVEPYRPPQERIPHDRSRPAGPSGSKSPTATSRSCRKCGEPLLGQFVRALGATYHLECFQCHVSEPLIQSYGIVHIIRY